MAIAARGRSPTQRSPTARPRRDADLSIAIDGEPASRSRSGRGGRRTCRRRRQQREPEDQGRGQVAEAGLEAAGHAARAGGRGRGDQPGQARLRGRPSPRRAAAGWRGGPGRATGRPAPGRRAAARGSRPVVEAGQEPVRPDRAVGQVAEDAVALRGRRAPARGRAARSGRGGGPRAAGCRCGRGCAGTSSRRRPARRGRRQQERAICDPRGAISDEPDDQHAGRQQEVELGPGGEAGREPGDDQRPGRRPPSAATRLRLSPPPRFPDACAQAASPGVHGNRNSSKQEEDPDDVVARLPGLIGQRRNAQRDRRKRQRDRRRPGTAARCTSRRPGTPTNQPRFSSGERRSRPKASIPTAWKHSELAG